MILDPSAIRVDNWERTYDGILLTTLHIAGVPHFLEAIEVDDLGLAVNEHDGEWKVHLAETICGEGPLMAVDITFEGRTAPHVLILTPYAR